MKELEKTKRISIAAVLSILLVMIALLSYKRPKNLYTLNAKTILEKTVDNDFFLSSNDIIDDKMVLIDIRNLFEYEKGHLDKAIHIYAPEVMNENNISFLNEIKNKNRTGVLYGNTPNEAIAPFMVLLQLGYDNLKILKVENNYSQYQLKTTPIEIEKPVADINQFIKESIKNAALKPKPLASRVIPKKVIPIKKKKKRVPEGGC